MSKSLGNIITISEAVKKYSGQVVRLALLSAHYSQPLDWNDELLKIKKLQLINGIIFMKTPMRKFH